MNPISPDIIPDGKWRFHMRPMIAVRTYDGVGEVYIMDKTIPEQIGDVERVTIGKQVYLPERTCYDDAGCCSECGNRIGTVAYGDGIRMEPKHCPHCGARIERRM